MTCSKTGQGLLTLFEHNGHQFPAIWQHMLPEEFSWMRLPKERMIDCATCNMVVTDGYRPDTKCCSYFPQIPNYMLGLALKDPGCRPLVERVIAEGHALPEGTTQSLGALQIATAEYLANRFGKSQRLRCPFLNAVGECGIYAFRGVVCGSFFCSNDHGDAGDRFWEDFQNVLRQIEVILSQRAMTAAGIDSATYHAQLDAMADRIDEMYDPATGGTQKWKRKLLFGEFFENEAAFFEACADYVIEHINQLYDIATAEDSCDTTIAFKYEKALEQGLSQAQRGEIQCLPETQGDMIPVGALWYKLQLSARRLWEIPFGEGKVSLNPKATIGENRMDDSLSRLHGDRPAVVSLSGNTASAEPRRYFLWNEEVAILKLFADPVVIEEALFEKNEIADFAEARDFLAECLRKSILVKADCSDAAE
ncbi:MAG: hypothetical protein JXX14_04220 [Deltaproteobacteria bacterium]|nr:hypothetical protein [Deltaproteobacteria bacterium]